MPWTITDDLERFAERAGPLLAEEPAERTVPLTVLHSLRRGVRWSDERMVFGWLEEDGAVRGAVCMTPPFELLLAVVPPEATDALAGALRAAATPLPGVHGSVEAAERFAASWAAATGARPRPGMRMLLYATTAVRRPEPPPAGGARLGEERDVALVCDWLRAFEQEAGTHPTDVEPGVRERVADRRLWLWEDDDRPVSVAARSPDIGGVCRVGPVYTPPEARRRGYAAGVTAACAADGFARGSTHVVLFADADNATSNSVYRRIGFEKIDERRIVHFDPPADEG